MVDLSRGSDLAMTQPMRQVGGVNSEQCRRGHQVFIILTNHTHHLSTLVTTPHLNVPKVEDRREDSEHTLELIVAETEKLQGFLGGGEFRLVVYVVDCDTIPLTDVVE